jgi:hypothetical protein
MDLARIILKYAAFDWSQRSPDARRKWIAPQPNETKSRKFTENNQ